VDFLHIGRSAAARTDCVTLRDLPLVAAEPNASRVAAMTLRIRGAESRRDHVERNTLAP